MVDGTSWAKLPRALKFGVQEGLTDFVVMPVQLEPKRIGEDCLAGKRGDEAQDLPRLIGEAQRFFGDMDVIVIGDTDCVRDDEDQLAEFGAERVLDVRVGDIDAFVDAKSAYDRVMVPKDQPEFRSTQWYALLEAETQKPERPLSDHFLVLSPIRILADDD